MVHDTACHRLRSGALDLTRGDDPYAGPRGSGRFLTCPWSSMRGHREGSLVKSSAAQYWCSASAGGRRLRRCMSLAVLYQCTHSDVIFSTTATVSSGPFRNGEFSRMHSVLYKPIVVSASALSYASPTVPINWMSPSRSRVSPKWMLVYWLPASEW